MCSHFCFYVCQVRLSNGGGLKLSIDKHFEMNLYAYAVTPESVCVFNTDYYAYIYEIFFSLKVAIHTQQPFYAL